MKFPSLRTPYASACLFLSLLALIGVLTPFASAQQVIHVPSEQATLQLAFAAVPDGGIIEIAAGTYSAPSGGFTLFNVPRGFTVRAATGASVVLTGGGTTDILRFANSGFSSARPVTFVGITFANGLSTTAFIGGAMTLVRAEASFVSCTFQNNGANSSSAGGGGGGAQFIDSSIVSFQSCTWTNNNSRNFGGAVSALNSRIFLRDCRLSGNRVNFPNHAPNAPGGAIFITGGPTGTTFTRATLRVAGCSFDNNQAGYVGGAIYSLGEFQNPLETPVVDLVVSNSSFTGNVAVRDPSVSFPSPAAGGAVHIEDQTTATFQNCRFTNNSARQGGAISSYRAITNFDGCVFKGNQATGVGDAESIGGSIIALSSDNADASTNGGTANRRSAVLNVNDSLFQGSGTGITSARQGGGIFTAGDLNAAFGLGGITQNGTPESNRAVVTLTRVAFSDFVAIGAGVTPGTGGAMMADFTTLTATNCIVENSTATDFGGGFEFVRECAVTVNDSTFARNSAGTLGGALTMFGGLLNLTNDNLVDNQITGAGNGAAITTSADPAGAGLPPTDMTGLIQSCVFSNNSGGAAIYDGDRSSAPFNRLQYSSNQIFPGDSSAFLNDVAGAQTVAQLNALSIPRSSGPSPTVKAPVANTVPAASPVAGALLMLPPSLFNVGAPGEVLPIPAFLAYASSGAAASLDRAALSNPATVVSTAAAGPHTLTVGGNSFSTNPPLGTALNISTRLAVGTDQEVLIGGFIIAPSSGAPKNVVVRAIGPTLPVANHLLDPVLELHDGTGAAIANNDNWRITQVGGVITSNQSVDIQGTSLAPTNDNESAIVATLAPGNYTVIVRGAANATGVGLVEVFDLDAVTATSLANISTRGLVQTDANVMIGGFIYGGGNGGTNVVVRGIGPSLVSSGVANPLPDPTLQLFDAQGTAIESNDDWRQSPQATAIQNANLAPALDAESALLVSGLPRGNYTAILKDKNGASGVGRVDVFVF
jgi:predicted outer membrane repeat protein